MSEKDKKKKAITDEIATSQKDIDIFSGWLIRLENPDPTLRTEANGKGLKLYDEIKKDCHAGSVLQTRYLAVTGKEWNIIPVNSEAEEPGKRDEEIADFVKRVLENTNFGQAMQELSQAILYGFYVAEVIWKKTDTGIEISKIRSKHPRRFSFTTDRELRLLTPSNMIEGEPLPERKFIHYFFGSSDNPYGEGLGQSLWWPVWFKKHGIKFWLVFLEKYGMPTAIGKYPAGTDSKQQQALLDAIDAIQNETGVKIPETMAIELLEATRSGNVTYESLCEYMDKQISKRVLGQTATTEGTPGKLGNEDAQRDVRQDYIESDASLLCECINETLVRWIVDYNFPGVSIYPKFKIRVQKEKDLKPQAERDKILVSDIGLPISEKYFYDEYGIKKPEDDEKIVIPINSISSNSKTEQAAFAEQKSDDLVDMYVDKLDREAANMINNELLNPVRDLIDNAESLEDIKDGLFDLYPKMEATELGNLMQKAFATAKLLGKYEVTNGD